MQSIIYIFEVLKKTFEFTKTFYIFLQAVKSTNPQWSTPVVRAKNPGSNPVPSFSNILASTEKRKFWKSKIFSTSIISSGTNPKFQVRQIIRTTSNYLLSPKVQWKQFQLSWILISNLKPLSLTSLFNRHYKFVKKMIGNS